MNMYSEHSRYIIPDISAKVIKRSPACSFFNGFRKENALSLNSISCFFFRYSLLSATTSQLRYLKPPPELLYPHQYIRPEVKITSISYISINYTMVKNLQSWQKLLWTPRASNKNRCISTELIPRKFLPLPPPFQCW
jgi:hypothetical protein